MPHNDRIAEIILCTELLSEPNRISAQRPYRIVLIRCRVGRSVPPHIWGNCCESSFSKPSLEWSHRISIVRKAVKAESQSVATTVAYTLKREPVGFDGNCVHTKMMESYVFIQIR
jgi:hypothetical protein